MINGDTVSVRVTKCIDTTGGVSLQPGTYSGIYKEDGGCLHERGKTYKVFRMPCVEVTTPEGYIFRVDYLDSADVPAAPKTLVSERTFDGYVGAQPVYGDEKP